MRPARVEDAALEAAGWDAVLLRKTRRCGCNVHTAQMVVAGYAAVLVLASFALVFVQYGGGLYLPAFASAGMYGLGAALGLLLPSLARETVFWIAAAGACSFAGMFPLGFELTYAGLPPFDRLFAAGPSWDGRVLLRGASAPYYSAMVLSLFYTLWIAAMILSILVVLFAAYMVCFVRCYNGPDAARAALFRPNWEVPGEVAHASFWTWRSKDRVMLVKYARVGTARLGLVGVFFAWCLSVNEIRQRNQMGGDRTYAWYRSSSPQFTLVAATAACSVDLVPHFTAWVSVGGLGLVRKSVPSLSRHMGGRLDYYLVLLAMVWLGALQSLFFFGMDPGARVLGNTAAYAAQINDDFGIVPAWSDCYAQPQCYALASPLYDGDVSYTLNKSTAASPQDFAYSTTSKDASDLWILLCGLALAVLLPLEIGAQWCTSRWHRGLDFDWHRVPPSGVQMCLQRYFVPQ